MPRPKPEAVEAEKIGQARLIKAHSLAAALFSIGATAGAVLTLPPEGWRKAAELASLREGRKVNPPHSQTTIDLVASLVAARATAEANAPADPFAGLC